MPLPPGTGYVALSPSPSVLPFLLAEVAPSPPGKGAWSVPGDFAQGLQGEVWFARTVDGATLETTGERALRL